MTALYRVEEMEVGLRCLNDLISVICEVQFELPAGTEDPRINNLLWIARDLSEGLTERFERNIVEGKGRARS